MEPESLPPSLRPLPSPTLLAVRHGQTEWNATQRWQGWADVDLDAVGVEQARRATARLAAATDGVTVRLVSSDLLRARRTAEILGEELGWRLAEVVPELRERSVGQWSGKTTAEIEATWPGQLDAWRRGELPMIPGGEAESHLSERILGALTRLCRAASEAGEVVVAVTHGGVIRTLTRHHEVAPRPVPNLGATWFRWRDARSEHAGELDLLDDAVAAASHQGTAL